MADGRKLTKDQEFAKLRNQWTEQALDDHGLKPGEALVLVCLAQKYLNKEKLAAYPSQETLAETTGMKAGTVQKHIAALASRGHFRIVRRGRGKQNYYYPIIKTKSENVSIDPHVHTDQAEVMTRMKTEVDPHVYEDMTRTYMRPTLLSNPFDEPIEGVAFQANADNTCSNGVNVDTRASDRGLNGRSVASTTLNHEEYFDDHFLAEHDVPSITYYDGPADPDDLIIEPEDQEMSLRPSTDQVEGRCHIYEESCEATAINNADTNAIIVTHDIAESYFERYLGDYLSSTVVDRMMSLLKAGQLTAGTVKDAIAAARESYNGNQKTA